MDNEAQPVTLGKTEFLDIVVEQDGRNLDIQVTM